MIYDLDTWCTDCIYYAKSTRSCDFFIIENRLRGCPGGDGCSAKRTKKDVKRMQPKWDTVLGRQMWAEGKSDREIADHFGIAPNTVLYQRQKKWEKETQCPPPEDENTPVVLLSKSNEEKEQNAPDVSESAPALRQPDLYEVLEAATVQLTGIQAICTAEAISQLWNWNSRENLLKARDAIDYLLKRMK